MITQSNGVEPNVQENIIVIVKAEAPFINKDIHDILLCDDSCTCTETGYFPTLTKHSHRGDYILDDKKKKKKKWLEDV